MMSLVSTSPMVDDVTGVDISHGWWRHHASKAYCNVPQEPAYDEPARYAYEYAVADDYSGAR